MVTYSEVETMLVRYFLSDGSKSSISDTRICFYLSKDVIDYIMYEDVVEEGFASDQGGGYLYGLMFVYFLVVIQYALYRDVKMKEKYPFVIYWAEDDLYWTLSSMNDFLSIMSGEGLREARACLPKDHPLGTFIDDRFKELTEEKRYTIVEWCRFMKSTCQSLLEHDDSFLITSAIARLEKTRVIFASLVL